MTVPDRDNLPEAVAAWLLAYDEELAGETSGARGQAVPLDDASVAQRLDSLRTCLDRLELARLVGTLHPPSVGGDTLCEPAAETQRPQGRERVGRFQIVRELGRGGCGIVFLAHDPRLGRPVALKVPRPEAIVSDEMRARFLREARVAARLDHPNLVAVHEVGQDGAVSYIASAYCDGPTLAQWLADRGGPVPVRVAARLVAELAAAVDYAHAHRVLHRDIKPSNVLLTRQATSADAPDGPGESLRLVPKLSDFGLAKLLEGEGDATRTGALLGTPAYMAPEQAQGSLDQIGPRTDVYALGAILYEVLAGRPPFRGAGEADTLRRIVCEEPVPPRRLRRELPRDLEAICLRCLEKKPLARYATAGDLAEDLGRFLRGEPTAARPANSLQWAARWARRRPAVAALTAVCTLLLIGLAAGGWWSSARLGAALRAARQHQREAEASGAEIQRRLYASDVRLAYEAWRADDATGMRRFLARHIPQPDAPDRRGFAWRLLWALCHTERAVLAGHEGDVYAVACAPDGKVFASAGRDGTVRIWDAATLRPRTVLAEHRDEVNGLAFSPDGRLLASASDDGTVRLWDVERRFAPHGTLRLPQGVYSACFSPDSTRLATCGRESVVRIWDVPSTAQIAELTGHTDTVHGLAFSADGRLLASVDDDGAVRLWNLVDYSERAAFNADEGGCTTLSLSHDGRVIATGHSDGRVRLWDVSSAEQLTELPGHTADVHSLAWSRDDSLVVSSARDGVIRVWKVLEETCVKLIGHDGGVWSAAFSSDERRIIAGGADATVRIFDTNAVAFERLATPHYFGTNDVAFSPDGQLLACGGGDRCVSLIDVATHQTRGILGGHLNAVVSVAFSPDGGQLASASWDGAIVVWDVAAERRIRRLAAHEGPALDAAFSPDGRYLATVGSDHRLSVWSAKTWSPLHELEIPVGAAALCFAPDGQTLVASNAAELLRWEVATWRTLPPLAEHTAPLNAVAYSTDGTRLATAGNDRTVRIWEANSGVCIGALPSRSSAVTGIAFSPDGRELAVSDKQGAVCVFDLATLQELLALEPGHGFSSVQYSPDGRRLAATAAGGVCRTYLWSCAPDAWDRSWGAALGAPAMAAETSAADEPASRPAAGRVERGTPDEDRLPPWRSLPQHPSAVRMAGFTPDDRALITCSSSGVLRVWDAPSGRLTAELSGQRELRRAANALSITPDGSGVITSTKAALGLWSLSDRSLVRQFVAPNSLATGGSGSVACTPDGRRVAAACSDGTSGFFALADGQREAAWPGEFLAISRDGRIMASFMPDSMLVEIRDVATREIRGVLAGHAGRVVQAAFSADDKLLATLSHHDRSLRVWDVALLRQVYCLQEDAKAQSPMVMAFSPVEDLLATAGSDNVVRFRAAQTGGLLAELNAHTSRIHDLAFSHDGRLLASVGRSSFNNGEVFLWTVAVVLRNAAADR